MQRILRTSTLPSGDHAAWVRWTCAALAALFVASLLFQGAHPLVADHHAEHACSDDVHVGDAPDHHDEAHCAICHLAASPHTAQLPPAPLALPIPQPGAPASPRPCSSRTRRARSTPERHPRFESAPSLVGAVRMDGPRDHGAPGSVHA